MTRIEEMDAAEAAVEEPVTITIPGSSQVFVIDASGWPESDKWWLTEEPPTDGV